MRTAAMDGLHHALDHRVEDLARFLWIAVGQQLHRALEVGEQDGDLLALTFEGALGGEDLLGEVLWGVDIWRLELWRHLRASAQRLRTAAAEVIAGVIAESARWADDRERCTALRAE